MVNRQWLVTYSKLKRVNSFCATLSGVILLFISFSVFADVFLRYLFNRPSIWITEVSTYLLLYLTFLGTSYALQEGIHIRVTFLLTLFNPRIQDVIDRITSLCTLFFCFVLFWQTGRMAWLSYSRSWTSPTLLSVPLIYINIAMVFGSFMLFLTQLFQTLFAFKGEQVLDKVEDKVML